MVTARRPCTKVRCCRSTATGRAWCARQLTLLRLQRTTPRSAPQTARATCLPGPAGRCCSPPERLHSCSGASRLQTTETGHAATMHAHALRLDAPGPLAGCQGWPPSTAGRLLTCAGVWVVLPERQVGSCTPHRRQRHRHRRRWRAHQAGPDGDAAAAAAAHRVCTETRHSRSALPTPAALCWASGVNMHDWMRPVSKLRRRSAACMQHHMHLQS